MNECVTNLPFWWPLTDLHHIAAFLPPLYSYDTKLFIPLGKYIKVVQMNAILFTCIFYLKNLVNSYISYKANYEPRITETYQFVAEHFSVLKKWENFIVFGIGNGTVHLYQLY